MRALILVLIFSIISCSGGGGSSSENSSAGQNAPTGIRVINAALDFPALQVKGSDGLVISSASFAEHSYHGAVVTGENAFTVVSVKSTGTALLSRNLTFEEDQRKTLFAFNGYQDQDLRFKVLDDASIEIPEGSTAVRFINGITNSSEASVLVPNVLNTNSVGTGSVTSYEFLPPGSYEFLISSATGNLGKTSGAVEQGKAYSIVGHGAAGYFVSTNLLED